MKLKIVMLPGDGIGPEIAAGAKLVLETVADKFFHQLDVEEALMGGAAYEKTGEPLPDATLVKCQAADAVFLAAVGGPQWDNLPDGKRPENGLLKIRKEMGLFANLRPAILFPQLAEASSLKASVLGSGLDILVIRELTGGAYFGEKAQTADYAYDTMYYTAIEIERVARVGFEMARTRGSKLMSVDKANVLSSSRLWREVVLRIASDYPDVALEHMYVDNCAMQLVRNPRQFDVIVTENMFGDILSDEAAMLTGSIGMLPSASLGQPGTPGLFEPIHGSAPKYAGMDIANPLASIMSIAMMMRYGFKLPGEANAIETAVQQALSDGFRTRDIMQAGAEQVGTQKMAALVAERI
jgi:3-isopropylmalate dehydrogenase